jgi:hypothetical protein
LQLIHRNCSKVQKNPSVEMVYADVYTRVVTVTDHDSKAKIVGRGVQ